MIRCGRCYRTRTSAAVARKRTSFSPPAKWKSTASSPHSRRAGFPCGVIWRLISVVVQDYIRQGDIHKLKDVMKESTNLGMKTFDQALFELYQAGEISYEDALRHADSTNEVRLKIKLAQGGDAHTLSQGLDGVELSETT